MYLKKYYALEPGKPQIKTYGDFWKSTGVVTAVFVLVTICVVYRKKYESGEDRAVWSLLKRLNPLQYRERQSAVQSRPGSTEMVDLEHANGSGSIIS